jgi:hypothetical protein
MPTNKLKDAQCKGAKPTGKPCKLFDGRGLYLYVSASGSKLWRATYAFNGKRSTASFGPYTDVSLAEAREKLSGLKRILRDGIDPAHKPEEPKPGIFLWDATRNYWGKRLDLSAPCRPAGHTRRYHR